MTAAALAVMLMIVAVAVAVTAHVIVILMHANSSLGFYLPLLYRLANRMSKHLFSP